MKFSHKIVCVLSISLLMGWIVYSLLGVQIIKAIYEGRSASFLNNLIHGRDVHPVEFYLQMADRIIRRICVYAVILCLWGVLLVFMERSLETKAVFFGINLCLILIFMAEILLHFFKFNEEPAEWKYPSHYVRRDDFGLWRAWAGKHRIFVINKKTGHSICDVEYSVDEYGRRVTPVKERKKRDKFVLFFGCSFTFGDGVGDNQTLAFEVGKNTGQYMPYNYGFSGEGPFDILAKIENIDFKNDVKEGNGISIYTFIDSHIHRTIGSASLMGSKFNDIYYRETNDGRLVRAGNFETGRPLLTTIYRILDKSKILKALRITFPMRIMEEHIKLTARTIQEMQHQFARKYPLGTFYVLIYPSLTYGKLLIPYLNEMGIKYLDYSDLFDRRDPRFRLAKEDGHPSPLAYRIIAERIIKDLRLE